MKLIDELRGFSNQMMPATLKIIEFVRWCADLGLSYCGIGLLLAFVVVCIGGVACIVGGAGATSAVGAASAGVSLGAFGSAAGIISKSTLLLR